MNEKIAQRASPPDAVANRHANAIVAPYVPLFSQWNMAAVQLAAKQASRLTTDIERRLLDQSKQALTDEIRSAMEQFRAAIAGEPANARIADVEASFRRLLELLG